MEKKEINVNVTISGMSIIMWFLLVMTAFAFGFALASALQWLDMLNELVCFAP